MIGEKNVVPQISRINTDMTEQKWTFAQLNKIRSVCNREIRC